MNSKDKHSKNRKCWRFFRAGGLDQVRIDSAADLLALSELDQKLWVALSCPVDHVHFDKRTLTLLDTEKDGKIHADELIKGIKWTAELLKDPELLIQATDGLSVDDIVDSSEKGTMLRESAKRVLLALKKEGNSTITVNEIQNIESILLSDKFNGDGIICETATNDEALRSCIRLIITTEGEVTDRSGAPGISAEKLSVFFNKARTCAEWLTSSQSLTFFKKEIDTSAISAYMTVKNKIDDYFNRCAIASYNKEMKSPLLASAVDRNTFTQTLVLTGDERIESMPLSTSSSGLTPGSEINPFWSARFDTFVTLVAQPVLGKFAALDQPMWIKIVKSMDPVCTWYNNNPIPGSSIDNIRNIASFSDSPLKASIEELIKLDLAEKLTFESLHDLEKLIRFKRDIYLLSCNFVNFRDFYSGISKAIFQAGTLFIDQRSCSLCIKVDDVSRHSSMAALAGTCLIYCECKRKNGTEKQTIVAALTNGDSENIMAGRNGLFYDRNGDDWDATVVKIIDNPISLRQAFWLPYKSFVRMIEAQVAKRASAAEALSNDKLTTLAASTANIDKNKHEKPASVAPKVDVGSVAALGVAAGAIGTFFATLFGYIMGIVKLGPFAIFGALAGVILLISGPSIILAYIKLRKRNLGPILDAGGWAINAKARINVPFGEMLTKTVALPPGSRRDLIDPYAEKKNPWVRLIILAVLVYTAFVVLDTFGYVYKWSNGMIGKQNIAVIQ
ncbi:MAG TPA: hypothetical protein VHO70_02650 [Chitinispirillaceae bacterium]|nr:hypothetical protein [Chitinispirillaceae bacterium]